MSWQFLWKILLEDVKPDSILEKKNYHLLLMIFLQALLMKPRRLVNQNKQILVKKISPIWHWFYIFQQNLSKKLLRQMLVRTEKGRTFIKWRTSRKNVHVIIIGRAIMKYAKTSIFLVLMTSQYIVQFNYLFPLEIQVQSCSTLWSLCQGFCSYFSSQRWVIDLCRDLFLFFEPFFQNGKYYWRYEKY